MSFPKARIERFNEKQGCGPAPGHYNVKNQENGPGGVKFESSTERFKEAPVLPGGNQKLHVRKCSISSDDSTTKTEKRRVVPPSPSKKEIDASKKQIRQTLQALNDKEKELFHSQNSLKKAEGQIKNLRKDCSCLEAKLLSKEKDFQNLNRKNDFLESKKGNEDVEKELKKMKASLIICKKQMEHDKMKLASMQCDNKALKEKNSNLKASNLNLEQISREVREHEDGVSEQLTKIQALNGNLRSINQALQVQLEDKCHDSQCTQAKCKAEVQRFQREFMAQCQTTFEDLKQTFGILMKRVDGSSAKIQSLTEVITRTRANNADLKQKNAWLEKDKELLKRKVDVSEGEKA